MGWACSLIVLSDHLAQLQSSVGTATEAGTAARKKEVMAEVNDASRGPTGELLVLSGTNTAPGVQRREK